MALGVSQASAIPETQIPQGRIVAVNSVPPGFDPRRDLPPGFIEFLLPLHAALTPRQKILIASRDRALAASLLDRRPNYLAPQPATASAWRIELPAWCADQRNQMTGPADDAELVVKMLNSGAPGVMLDLEDSTANQWEHISRGIENILQALCGPAYVFRSQARSHCRHSSQQDRHLHAPSRPASSPGRHFPRRIDSRAAV